MTLVQPTGEMQQHIRSELNEDVSTRDKDLEHIKEWLHMQPHLPQFQGKPYEKQSNSQCTAVCLSVFSITRAKQILRVKRVPLSTEESTVQR